MREAGSGGRYTGRSCATRSLSTVRRRSHPTRSAITVAGIRGYSRSSSRIRGSTASTADPFGARSYRGGPGEANAFFTVFRATPLKRAISEIDTPSARNRRISAQSLTLITHSRFTTRWSEFTRRQVISFQASSTRRRSADLVRGLEYRPHSNVCKRRGPAAYRRVSPIGVNRSPPGTICRLPITGSLSRWASPDHRPEDLRRSQGRSAERKSPNDLLRGERQARRSRAPSPRTPELPVRHAGWAARTCRSSGARHPTTESAKRDTKRQQ